MVWSRHGIISVWVKKRDTRLVIGNKVHAQCRTRIICAKLIQIGNDVLIGPDVFITDHNHGMNPEMWVS